MQATTEGRTAADARPRAFRPEMADRFGTGTEAPGWDLGPERRIDDGRALARLLGWFSLGLGAAELLAPRTLTRALGAEGHEALVRGYGLRELASGAGILSRRRPTGWVWSRVAGDALDLATLGSLLRGRDARRRAVMAVMGAVAGVMVLDALAGTQLARRGGRSGR